MPKTETKTRCSEQVCIPQSFGRFRQCCRWAVEGDKCKQHAASTREAKSKAREARWLYERKHREATCAIEAVEREIVDAVVDQSAAFPWGDRVRLRDQHIAAVAALKELADGK